MNTNKIGLFTGTFDPVTFGHLDIIKRASLLFDKLYVGIFKNDKKNPMFMTDLRAAILREELKDWPNVEVIVHEKDLTVNVAKNLGVTALVRSVRNSTDLEYEKNMYYFNFEMTGVETVLLMAKAELEPLNSTRMRELSSFGQDLSKWLPTSVIREMEKLHG